MTKPKATDFVGQRIKIGDAICYPVRRGSHMCLKRCKVTNIVQHDHTQPPILVGINPAGHKVTIYNLHNCIVVNGSQ